MTEPIKAYRPCDEAPAVKIMTSSEFRQTYDYKLSAMSDRNFAGELRRAETVYPYTAIGGGISATVGRVLLGDLTTNDPYCLRAPKRKKRTHS